MRSLCRNLLILLIVVTLTGPAFSSPTRRALVIGNDTYPGNNLRNARNDATSIAAALTALGYTATLALDVDRRAMATAIDDFAGSLVTGDTALVYYAGHGLQVGGENYLVPVDFQVSDAADARNQGYALSALLGKLSEHGATTQIVILDACRDNPFIGTRSLTTGWASVVTSAGTFLAFGTAPGFTASDDPAEGHGLFTKSLLQFLPSQLDIDQMFEEVRQDVIQRSNGHQVPWTASSLIGSFHIDPKSDLNASTLQALSSNFRPGSEPQSRSLGVPSETFGRGTTLSNRDIDNMLSDTMAQVRALHFGEAMSILRRILSLDPRCAIALRLLGAVYALVGRNVEAYEVLNREIAANPFDALALSYRCILGAADGIGSETDCREAILLHDLPQSHIGLALSLASAGKGPEAYEEATRAIALDPTSVVGYSLRGEIAAALNQGDKAQQDQEKAASLAIEQAK